eukprot:4373306-Amphidinium_carterae.1
MQRSFKDLRDTLKQQQLPALKHYKKVHMVGVLAPSVVPAGASVSGTPPSTQNLGQKLGGAVRLKHSIRQTSKPTAKLTVLQWNVCSIRQRGSEVNKLVADHQPTIVVLSETHCAREALPAVPGYKLAAATGRQAGKAGGTA